MCVLPRLGIETHVSGRFVTTELPEKPLLCYLSYSVPNVGGSVLGGHAVEYVRVSNSQKT